MGYTDVDDSFASSGPEGQPYSGGPIHPNDMDPTVSKKTVAGYAVPGTIRRLFVGLADFSPLLIASVAGIGKPTGEALVFHFYAFLVFFGLVIGTSGRYTIGGVLFGTMVVDFSRDSRGRLFAYQPSSKTLVLRTIVSVLIDPFLAPLSVLLTAWSQSMGDLVARTTVIRRNQPTKVVMTPRKKAAPLT